ITTYWKNKSSSQHVKSTNTASYKYYKPIALDPINQNRPTKETVNLRLNTTRQFLHLVQDQGYTKMETSNLLAKSLGKGSWHAWCIRTWANQWKNCKELIKSKCG
ncbi:8969_t:CDS:2, partial [Scutellospora calospora]